MNHGCSQRCCRPYNCAARAIEAKGTVRAWCSARSDWTALQTSRISTISLHQRFVLYLCIGADTIQYHRLFSANFSHMRDCVQDYVKLASWEHHGFHDLRLAAEASQRKLHKCRRQAVVAAKAPVSPLFARLADALGIPLVRGLAAGLSVNAVLEGSGEAQCGQVAAELDAVSLEPVAPAAPEKLGTLELPESWAHDRYSEVSNAMRTFCAANLAGALPRCIIARWPCSSCKGAMERRCVFCLQECSTLRALQRCTAWRGSQ